MSFGIIRVRKLSSNGQIKNTEIHNARLYDEIGKEKPPNILAEQKFGDNTHENIKEKALFSAIEERIKETGAKTRKNSVKALEFVVALSPDVKKAYNDYSATAVLIQLYKYVEQKMGKENIVSASMHFDESNPHMHIVATPITRKTTKWKNRNGEGEKTVNTLCADHFVGSREKLRNMQTEFFEHVKETLGKRLEPFNVEFFRGKDARYSRKRYTRKTIHELGELRELKEEMEKMQDFEYKNEFPLRDKTVKQEQNKDLFKELDPFKEQAPKEEKKDRKHNEDDMEIGF